MNSTKPTTFARAAARSLAAAAVAAIAAFALYQGVRDVRGGLARTQGAALLADAERTAPGPAKQALLLRAQRIVREGVDLTPYDADLWNLLAEDNLAQANGGVGSAHEALLAAAAEASARASTLAPRDPVATARIAYARALQEDGKAEVDAALARSYASIGFDPVLGPRRVEAAGRAWTALSESVRQQALGEACLLARSGDAARKTLYELRMGPAEPGMALALDKIMSDSDCAASN